MAVSLSLTAVDNSSSTFETQDTSASKTSFKDTLSVKEKEESLAELRKIQNSRSIEATRAAVLLSDANSFITIAEEATNAIGGLLERAEEIAETLQTAITSEQRDALAAEGASIITEIGEVVSNATYNDTSVFNAGAQNITFDLNGAEDSSLSEVSLTISNIAATAADLGITGVTASSFQNNPASVQSTLETAQAALLTATTELSASRDSLTNAIEQVYARTQRSEELRQQVENEESFQQLLKNISQKIKEDENLNFLDPVNVSKLISVS